MVKAKEDVFLTIDFWIRNHGDNATLDSLFRFMDSVDLLEALKDRLNQRLKSQTSQKGGCFI